MVKEKKGKKENVSLMYKIQLTGRNYKRNIFPINFCERRRLRRRRRRRRRPHHHHQFV